MALLSKEKLLPWVAEYGATGTVPRTESVDEYIRQVKVLFHECLQLPDRIVAERGLLKFALRKFDVRLEELDHLIPFCSDETWEYASTSSPFFLVDAYLHMQRLVAILEKIRLCGYYEPVKDPRRTEDGALPLEVKVNQLVLAMNNGVSLPAATSPLIDLIFSSLEDLKVFANQCRPRSTRRAQVLAGYVPSEETAEAIKGLSQATSDYLKQAFPKTSETLRNALVVANAERLKRLSFQKAYLKYMERKRRGPPVLLDKKDWKFCPEPYLLFEDLPATGPAWPWMPLYGKCVLCGFSMHFNDIAKWRAHLLEDLEPFICIRSRCLESSLGSNELETHKTLGTWATHLKQTCGGSAWHCQHSTHERVQVFYDIAKYKRHLSRVHQHPEEDLKGLAESNYWRHDKPEPIDECPFCDDYKESGPNHWRAHEMFPRPGLRDHIMRHMEDVALLVVRWLPIDEQPPRAMLPYELPPRDAGMEYYASEKDPKPAEKTVDREDLENCDDEADKEGRENPAWIGKQLEEAEGNEDDAEKGTAVEEAKGLRCLPL